MNLRPSIPFLQRPLIGPLPVTGQCHPYYSQPQNRHPQPGFQQQKVRPFSTSKSAHDDPTPNHYEILKIPPTATKAELKKQFYILSKETHPDMHPHDPRAGERFAQVSESYSVLSNDEKRRKYDRDVMRHYQRTSGNRTRSGSGTSFAGSRPATGLSKRRGTFRGPPPSFYAHGDPSENTQRQSDRAEEQAGSFRASAYTEPGTWDPAFNPRPIHRTQSAEDKRRDSRRAAAMAAAQEHAEEEGAFWARFVIVSGIVGIGVGLGSVVVGMNNAPRGGGLTKPDGSRRDAPRINRPKVST